MDELSLFRMLQEHGVGFVLNVPGGGFITLSVEDVAELVQDPQSASERLLGVSQAQIGAWHEAGGTLRCAANTAGGRRCRNSVADGLDVRQWALRQGEFCKTHGGGDHG